MDQNDNSFAVAATDGIAGVDYLVVDGNVNNGKDKGQGQLLFTRTSVFAFRANNKAMMTGGAMGGLIGSLIGHFVDKQLAKKQTPSEHMEDPEIQRLGESVRKRIDRASLLTKFPLDRSLNVTRTKLGFTFARGDETPMIYQGLFHKHKIIEFLGNLGIDVR